MENPYSFSRADLVRVASMGDEKRDKKLIAEKDGLQIGRNKMADMVFLLAFLADAPVFWCRSKTVKEEDE